MMTNAHYLEVKMNIGWMRIFTPSHWIHFILSFSWCSF